MDITCHDSYPLNSANARPFGTFTVFLSCAEKARLPIRTSIGVTIASADVVFPFIASTSLGKSNALCLLFPPEAPSGGLQSHSRGLVLIPFHPLVNFQRIPPVKLLSRRRVLRTNELIRQPKHIRILRPLIAVGPVAAVEQLVRAKCAPKIIQPVTVETE